MNRRQFSGSALWAAFLSLVALSTLLTATYAWFSGANQKVSTNRAEVRTGSTSLALYISETTDFSEKKTTADIIQLNATASDRLMPVSTDDLVTFVTDTAGGYRPVEQEELYYHGRVYLMAQGEGNGNALLFWDGTGSPLSQLSGQMQNAARLGLVFRDGNTTAASRILSLSDSANTGASAMNTILNGTPVASGNVLHCSGNTVSAVSDPAKLYTAYCVSDSAAPEEPLCILALNKTYTLDIYFYLEGCDPDCLNEIALNSGDLGLRFFAQPE